MRVFLTGGTGFIGQAVVRALRRRDWPVAALVRDPAGAPARWLAAQGCRLVAGDVTNPDGLEAAMAGSDAVLHSAGVYEIGASRAERERMRRVNVEGTDAVLGAASRAGVPRAVYVSTAWALGPTTNGPADESHHHPARFLTPYEESKVRAHEVALQWRGRGLPLVVAMPNAVAGANDHSVFGYFLRLYLLGAMPPISFGGDAVYAPVDVMALAEGLCVAAERAPTGEDYLFCGEAEPLRATFERWRRYPGGMKAMVWLPRGVMAPVVAPLEPLERALRLPAFLSRDTVRTSRGSLNYHSAKARRDLGWTHPTADDMWDRIVGEERTLMAQRKGFLARLRHQAVPAG
jgi:dihydroflavonol-4-reductase